MTLIAFSGRLGSGKDTAGERLAAMVDVPTYQLSFARLLKESAAALFDIPVKDWETYKNDPDAKVLLQVGWDEAEIVQDHTDDGDPITNPVDVPHIVKEFTAREVLQRYGTEAHRKVFGDDFWVDQAMVTYDANQERNKFLFYVTDCRFSNEALAVLNRGGVVVRVTGANEETGTHASETPLPNEYITFDIDNSIRDDNFAALDHMLKGLANYLGLPLKAEALR